MEQGIVKFYKNDKGWGFIKDSSGKEIFVHASGLTEDVSENDEVEFDLQEGKKGPVAVNVQKVKVRA